MTDQTDPPTRQSEVGQVPAGAPDRTPPARRPRRGKAAKQHLILTGLGVAVPAVDMTSSDGRLALIAAVVVAVAEGRCSGFTATTLLAAIREARAERQDELERLAQAQARRIEELERGNVVDVRRR